MLKSFLGSFLGTLAAAIAIVAFADYRQSTTAPRLELVSNYSYDTPSSVVPFTCDTQDEAVRRIGGRTFEITGIWHGMSGAVVASAFSKAAEGDIESVCVTLQGLKIPKTLRAANNQIIAE